MKWNSTFNPYNLKSKHFHIHAHMMVTMLELYTQAHLKPLRHFQGAQRQTDRYNVLRPIFVSNMNSQSLLFSFQFSFSIEYSTLNEYLRNRFDKLKLPMYVWLTWNFKKCGMLLRIPLGIYQLYWNYNQCLNQRILFLIWISTIRAQWNINDMKMSETYVQLFLIAVSE